MRRPRLLLPSAWVLGCCLVVMPVIGDHAEAMTTAEAQPCRAGAESALLPSPRLMTTQYEADASHPAAGTPVDTGVGLTLWRRHLDSGSLDATALFARLDRSLAYHALLL